MAEFEPYSAEEFTEIRSSAADIKHWSSAVVGRLIATVDRVTEAYQDAVTERGMVEGHWRKVMPFQWEYIALVVECVDRQIPVPVPEVLSDDRSDVNVPSVVTLWSTARGIPAGPTWRVGWIDASGYVCRGAVYSSPAEMAEAIRRWRPTS